MQCVPCKRTFVEIGTALCVGWMVLMASVPRATSTGDDNAWAAIQRRDLVGADPAPGEAVTFDFDRDSLLFLHVQRTGGSSFECVLMGVAVHRNGVELDARSGSPACRGLRKAERDGLAWGGANASLALLRDNSYDIGEELLAVVRASGREDERGVQTPDLRSLPHFGGKFATCPRPRVLQGDTEAAWQEDGAGGAALAAHDQWLFFRFSQGKAYTHPLLSKLRHDGHLLASCGARDAQGRAMCDANRLGIPMPGGVTEEGDGEAQRWIGPVPRGASIGALGTLTSSAFGDVWLHARPGAEARVQAARRLLAADGRRVFLATFLRDPVERLLSEGFRPDNLWGKPWPGEVDESFDVLPMHPSDFYCPDDGAHLGGGTEWMRPELLRPYRTCAGPCNRRSDGLECLENCARHDARNRQVRALAQYAPDDASPCWDRGLEDDVDHAIARDWAYAHVAMRVLREDVHFFGLTEFRQASRNLFERTFALSSRVTFPPAAAEMSPTPHADALARERGVAYVEGIRRHLAPEIAFYGHAQELFFRRLERLGIPP